MPLEIKLAVKCPFCGSEITVNADDIPAFESGSIIEGYCQKGHCIMFNGSAYKRKEGE